MSRIGKKPVMIPAGVEVKLTDGMIEVKGPNGTLQAVLHEAVKVDVQELEDGKAIIVTPVNEEDLVAKAMWGTTRANIANMVNGVTEGFSKSLEVVGVGYKVNMKGKDVVFDVGYSHPVEFKVPEGITVTVEKNAVTVTGADRQMVGEVAAEMRKIRKPEPYKGKGIKYTDEVVRRKAGKAAKAGE
jgi:large subunit ribosomal protein L6